MFNYGFSFEYREKEGSELKKERFFITSRDRDIENACTIAMLQFIQKHNYYSGKLIKTIKF